MGPHTPTLSAELRDALDALRRIVQTLRVSGRDAERQVGLTAAQLFALQQLASVPGASVNDLAQRTFTHQSSVSVVVRKLVERRLVAKVTAPDDRRRVRLAVTDARRALLRRSPEPAQDRLIAGLAALQPGQRHALVQALSDVAETMSKTDGPPPMLFEDAHNGHRRALARQPPRRRSKPRRPLRG